MTADGRARSGRGGWDRTPSTSLVGPTATGPCSPLGTFREPPADVQPARERQSAAGPVVGTRLVRRYQPTLSNDGDLQTPESVLLVLGEQQLGHPAVRDGRSGSSRKHEHWNTPCESLL